MFVRESVQEPECGVYRHLFDSNGNQIDSQACQAECEEKKAAGWQGCGTPFIMWNRFVSQCEYTATDWSSPLRFIDTETDLEVESCNQNKIETLRIAQTT